MNATRTPEKKEGKRIRKLALDVPETFNLKSSTHQDNLNCNSSSRNRLDPTLIARTLNETKTLESLLLRWQQQQENRSENVYQTMVRLFCPKHPPNDHHSIPTESLMLD
jgi:hypothetical protein